MKKLNRKGFTLIELLAVITILGILMLVAIPAVSRTIENSRRDTFMDTAKSYMNAVKTSVAADEVKCGDTMISAMGEGYYYIKFNSSDNTGTDLMEQGGKSSWGNAQVKGVVLIKKTVEEKRTKYTYSVIMVDAAGRGIGKSNGDGNVTETISEGALSRANVITKNADNRSTFFTKHGDPFGSTQVDGTQVTSAPSACVIAM